MNTELPVVHAPARIEDIHIPEIKPVRKSLIITGFIATLAPLIMALAGVLLFLLVAAFSVIFVQEPEKPVISQRVVMDGRMYDVAPEPDAAIPSGTAGTGISDRTEIHKFASEVEAMREAGPVAVPPRSNKNTELIGLAGIFAHAFFNLAFYGSIFAVLVGLVIYSIVLYKGWRTLQAMRYIDPAGTLDMPTAESAAGLLFVPYFNLYWIFPVSFGLERYGRRLSFARGVEYVGPSRNLITGILVMLFANLVIPFLPLIAMIFMAFMLIQQVNRMVEVLGKPYSFKALG